MEFISGKLKKMPLSRKISYLALMTALSVIVNMYSLDLLAGNIKLSFVTAICVISGAIFGPFYAFAIGFLGDLISFLVIPSSLAYSPLIGLSNGVYGFISGFVFFFVSNKNIYIKTFITILIGYFICTLFITSVGIYVLFGSKYTFGAYILKRVIFQTPVTIANYFIAVLLLKAFKEIKFLKIESL